MKQLKNRLLLKPWFGWIVLLLVILLGSYYVSNNWYQLMLIQGRSMTPAYYDKQLVLLNRHDMEFTYGDVIAFKCDGLSAVLVKRIVACPGDTVVIDNGTLIVNGGASSVYPENDVFVYEGILEESVCLDKEQYIVLGDNILESRDSRYPEVGCVSKMDILGKIAYPINSK